MPGCGKKVIFEWIWIDPIGLGALISWQNGTTCRRIQVEVCAEVNFKARFVDVGSLMVNNSTVIMRVG